MLHQRTRPAPDAEPFRTPATSPTSCTSPQDHRPLGQDGRLPHQRTLGGHRRDPDQAIRQLAASLAKGVRAS